MRRIETILVDDIDRTTTAGVETVEVKYNGETFSLDLSKKHRAELNRALKRYIDAAAGGARATASTPRATPMGAIDARKEENARIRKWAQEHGLETPKRGRLPGALVAKYNEYEAHHTHVG